MTPREHRMCVSKRRFESREAAVFFASARLHGGARIVARTALVGI